MIICRNSRVVHPPVRTLSFSLRVERDDGHVYGPYAPDEAGLTLALEYYWEGQWEQLCRVDNDLDPEGNLFLYGQLAPGVLKRALMRNGRFVLELDWPVMRQALAAAFAVDPEVLPLDRFLIWVDGGESVSFYHPGYLGAPNGYGGRTLDPAAATPLGPGHHDIRAPWFKVAGETLWQGNQRTRTTIVSSSVPYQLYELPSPYSTRFDLGDKVVVETCNALALAEVNDPPPNDYLARQFSYTLSPPGPQLAPPGELVDFVAEVNLLGTFQPYAGRVHTLVHQVSDQPVRHYDEQGNPYSTRQLYVDWPINSAEPYIVTHQLTTVPLTPA